MLIERGVVTSTHPEQCQGYQGADFTAAGSQYAGESGPCISGISPVSISMVLPSPGL